MIYQGSKAKHRKNKTNKYSVPYTSGIGYFASFGVRYFDGGYNEI